MKLVMCLVMHVELEVKILEIFEQVVTLDA